jgi:MoaA/NifB/PqqE/SkfB family radical SAM enzyme
VDYFRFYPDCHYVAGSVRGAVYCLTEHRLIHLSQEETQIINKWLDNQTVQAAVQIHGETAKNLLGRLVKNGVGTTFSAPVFVEEYEPSKAYKKMELLDLPPNVRMAYVQVSDKCQGACSFCGDSEYLVSNGCTSCLRWRCDGETALRHTDRNVLLNQLQDLEPAELIFSGGNPLLEWDKVVGVAAAANRRPSLRVVVHTNGAGFTDQVEKDARELKIEFVFTVFAESRAGYARITGNADLYDELLRAVQRCRTSGLRHAFCVLVSPESWTDYTGVRRFVDNLDGQFVNVCEVVAPGEKSRPLASLPLGAEEGERYFARLDASSYFHARRFNQCLDGKVALSAGGTLLPCPHWQTASGRFPDTDVFGFFRGRKQRKTWTMTKNEVPVCDGCEFRFACADCSLTEEYRKNDREIHAVFCTYQPETGEWMVRPPDENRESVETLSTAGG